MTSPAPGRTRDTGPPPSARKAPVVLAIAAICVAIELMLWAADRGLVGSSEWRGLAYRVGAFWPGLLRGWQPVYVLQPAAMFVTHVFLHGGLGHLLGNMITLLALGEIVVDRVGQRRFLLIFGASALGGAATFGLLASTPQPMVGASGALFGLAGAWQLWAYRDARGRGGRMIRLLRSLAALILLNAVLWWVLDGALAWQTHLGGFVTGWLVALLVRDRRLPRRRRVRRHGRGASQ